MENKILKLQEITLEQMEVICKLIKIINRGLTEEEIKNDPIRNNIKDRIKNIKTLYDSLY